MPAEVLNLRIGLEVHVELSARTKMFSRALSPAGIGPEAESGEARGERCLDAVVLGLPGALPVANESAVDQAIRVGLALGCVIAPVTRWDRKSYFYPDLPKGYQISQYDRPVCGAGVVELPRPKGGGGGAGGGGGPVAMDWEGYARGERLRVGIVRAHLEEDAGKLLHEAPGGGAIEGSIVDYARAGTALLEIVTAPDFSSADEVVLFGQVLHRWCRWLGVTRGVLQEGHMRFEPNINARVRLGDGREAWTPVVEVKNLNSFRAVRGAIEYEAREQAGRLEREGVEFGPGTKQTRGWDEARGVTVVQREKEDAHDYRYFPDPDLLAVEIGAARVERVREAMAREGVSESPVDRQARWMRPAERGGLGLDEKASSALLDDPADGRFFEACVAALTGGGAEARSVSNLLLQSGARRVNEGKGKNLASLGITPGQVAQVATLRAAGTIGGGVGSGADALFSALCERGDAGADAAALAAEMGLLIQRDQGALEAWVAGAIAEQGAAAADVRAGKMAAIGRLVGAVMKASGGRADASAARAMIEKALRPPG